MEYKEYFSKIEAEYTKKTIDEETLNSIEMELNLKFGPELREYILTYGYLAFQSVEFYGINSIQGLDSDMVKQTIYLHKYFEKTNEYVALGNLGEGKYALVSQDDLVFEYDTERDLLNNSKKGLFNYIMDRFDFIK